MIEKVIKDLIEHNGAWVQVEIKEGDSITPLFFAYWVHKEELDGYIESTPYTRNAEGSAVFMLRARYRLLTHFRGVDKPK